MRPAIIACTKCGADATSAATVSGPTTRYVWAPHEARYVEAHKADGDHALYVCATGHRLILRTPRTEDATKPSEVELATSIARAGLVR